MLLLMLYVGEAAFALDTEFVVEVVPKVNLKKIPHAPEYVSGLMNFGGLPIPIIDLCQLLENRPSSNALHTRIILLKYEHEGENQYLGLLGEKITETLDRERSAFIESGFSINDLPFLKGVSTEEEFTIQYLSVPALFNMLEGTLFKA